MEVFNQSSGDIFAPTFVYDLDGCQANRNAVDVSPGGWFDACLVGVTGDWMIRAVVDCTEATPPEPPTQAPFPHDFPKNRYISIDRGNPGLDFFDIKLTLAVTQVNSVPGAMIGSEWWAGCPDEDCISIVGRARSASPPDWSRCSTVHLAGCPIVPTSTYEIVVVDGANESAPVYDGQTQVKPGVKWWADTVGFFDGVKWTPPQGTVNIDDAVAGIKTFQNPNAFNAAHVSVVDVHPNDPSLQQNQINKIVNINDVFQIVLGFQGNEYGGGNIGLCPNADDPCPGPCPGAADDTPCDDADACTVGDTCQGGVCTPGTDECKDEDKEPGTKFNEFAAPFPYQ